MKRMDIIDSNRSRRIIRYVSDFCYLLPALILFGYFVILSFFQGISVAFCKWDGISPSKTFIGLRNFQTILIDPSLRNALWVSFQFTIYGLIFSTLIGLAFALLFHKGSYSSNISRSMIFLPYIISGVLTSYIWSYTFNDFGHALLGIRSPLTSPDSAVVGVSIMSLWHNIGFCMVIYIAGLNAVPNELYEAAVIEGANKWQQFIYVTIPMISSSFTVTTTMLLAFGMKVFDFPYIATQGGPGRATESLAIVIYRNLFTYRKAGYGQAIALLFTVVLFLFSFFVSKVMRSWEVEV